LTSNDAKGRTENIARPNGSNELFGWNKAKSRMASHGRLIRNFTSRLPRSYTVGSLMSVHEKRDVPEEARADRGWPDQGQQPGQGSKEMETLPREAASEHETASFRVEDGIRRPSAADRLPNLDAAVWPSGSSGDIIVPESPSKVGKFSFNDLVSLCHIEKLKRLLIHR
jgi:hypothetical protein